MRLVLDADGFDNRGLWGQSRRYRWSEAANFIPVRIGRTDTVAFDEPTKSSALTNANDRPKTRLGKTPLSDDFGLNKSDLAHLMNLWREKALRKT